MKMAKKKQIAEIENESAEFERVSKLYFSRIINEPLETPECLHININFACNLRCTICSISRKTMIGKKELTTAEVKKIIRQGSAMGIKTLLLLGGEPFLRKDILQISTYAENMGMQVAIITNGTLIDKALARRIIASKLEHLDFSIDGLEKGHDKIRGKGTFKKTLKAISILEGMIEKSGSKLTIGTNFTITNSNVSEMMPTVRFFEKRYKKKNPGCFDIHFQPLVSNNARPQKIEKSPEELKPGNFRILEKNMAQLASYIHRHKNRGAQSIVRSQTIEHLEAIRKYFEGTLKPDESKCYAGFNRLMTTQRGQFYLCGTSFGDVRKQKLADAWRSEEAKNARKFIKKCKHPCANFCQYLQNYEITSNSFNELAQNFVKKIRQKESYSDADKVKFIINAVHFTSEMRGLLNSKLANENEREERRELADAVKEINQAEAMFYVAIKTALKTLEENFAEEELENTRSKKTLEENFAKEELENTRSKNKILQLLQDLSKKDSEIHSLSEQSAALCREKNSEINLFHKQLTALSEKNAALKAEISNLVQQSERLQKEISEFRNSKGYRFILKPVDSTYKKMRKIVNGR
jgi:MoaA/NifB/PqqE/SkfB family radical SAM enzyme